MPVVNELAKTFALNKVGGFLSEHKGTILTCGTIIFNASGIVTTYKNSQRIHEIIESTSAALSTVDPDDRETRTKIIKVAMKELAPLVAPIAAFFAASTACAIVNQKQNEAKIAALTAALSIARTTITEYDTFKEEAKKMLGDEKFKEVQTEVGKREAEKAIEEAQKNHTVINPGSGKEVCYIPLFGVTFANTEDGIEVAMLKVNEVLDRNRLGGKSYGHESRYSREIVLGEDLLTELKVDANKIPDSARILGWEAGRVDEILWNISREDMNGLSYIVLNIFTTPCDVTSA